MSTKRAVKSGLVFACEEKRGSEVEKVKLKLGGIREGHALLLGDVQYIRKPR